MGYYYKDPSGLGVWYVNDNETPAQAFDRTFGGTGASVDDKLRMSVAVTPAAHQLAWQQPPAAPSPVPPVPKAPAAAPPNAVHTVTPAFGLPRLFTPPIKSKFAPVVTGEPITTAILTGLSVIFSIFGLGGLKDVKAAIETLRIGIKTVFNTLMNFIWTMSHIVRWVLNALRQLWENVLKPLIEHINTITQRIAAIINRVLRPYLQLIDHIRKQILEIYRRFFLPVIRFIQEIRVLISILRLAHVPGMKALDQKLAKIEGKLIGIIQTLLSSVNDHSGLFNILMTARNTMQHGVLIRSMYETQGAWVNEWWNSQEWDRSADDQEKAIKLDLAIQSQPGDKSLKAILSTGVYAAVDAPGPGAQDLAALLKVSVL